MNLSFVLLNEIKKLGVEVDEQRLLGGIDSVLSKYVFSPKQLGQSEVVATKTVVDYFLSCKKAQGCTAGTISTYNTTLIAMLEYVGSDFNTINVNQLRSYASMIISTYKNSTANSKLTVLKSFFKWCDSEGFQNQLYSKVHIPKVDRNLRKPLNTTEVEEIRSACETKRERALVEVLLSTGCRVSELEKLNKNDILGGSCIIRGKCSVERKIFINEKALFYLNEYLNDRDDDCDAIFTTERGEVRVLSGRSIEKSLSKIGSRVGIHLYPHRLRHTLATNLLRNGADLTSIQRILGHSSVTVTQVYSKTDDSAVEFDHYKYSGM